MASKNAVVQSSRKATRSTSQGSTAVSAASGGVMTRSMAKAAASSAKEPAVVTATSKLHNTPNGNSKIADGVAQIALDALKQKSVISFKMPQTISRGMDELQTHTNPPFQLLTQQMMGTQAAIPLCQHQRIHCFSVLKLNLLTLLSYRS